MDVLVKWGLFESCLVVRVPDGGGMKRCQMRAVRDPHWGAPTPPQDNFNGKGRGFSKEGREVTNARVESFETTRWGRFFVK